MSYSIKPILHNYVNKKTGASQIVIQVICDKNKVYKLTPFKVKPDQFSDRQIIGHIHSHKMNLQLREWCHDMEADIIEEYRFSNQIDLSTLKRIVLGESSSMKFIDVVKSLSKDLAGQMSKDTIKHYNSLANKIEIFEPGILISKMTADWMKKFETYLTTSIAVKRKGKTLDENTVQTNMRTLKAVLNKAAVKKLIRKSQFEDYKVPAYKQKIPEYLNEQEKKSFYEIVQKIENPNHKLAGYYFLFACYTGYRHSDLRAFNYSKMVKGDNIVIRAKKNGSIVSIPIYDTMRPVLNWVKERPLILSEQKTREYVKDIAKMMGITRKINIHVGRHSFAVMLASKGFSIEEAAELLGDSLNVAKVYYRITNEQLKEKVKNLL